MLVGPLFHVFFSFCNFSVIERMVKFEKDDLDQQMVQKAPIGWLKHTTHAKVYFGQDSL